jgi:hypothetical protein
MRLGDLVSDGSVMAWERHRAATGAGPLIPIVQNNVGLKELSTERRCVAPAKAGIQEEGF